MTAKDREEAINWMRVTGRSKGIDYHLQKHNLDVIIGPADCECTEPAAAAGMSTSSLGEPSLTSVGYPLATMPLSYLNLNGRPFGMSATASAGREDILIQVLSAWEATFQPRIPPTLLERSAQS